MDGRRYDVFLSHASADGEHVDAFLPALRGLGLTVWCSRERPIDVGIDFGAEITDALTVSSRMVLLLSKSSMDSKHVANELRMAEDEGIAVIPIRLDKTPLNSAFKYRLTGLQTPDIAIEPIEKIARRVFKNIRGVDAPEPAKAVPSPAEGVTIVDPPKVVSPPPAPAKKSGNMAFIALAVVALLGGGGAAAFFMTRAPAAPAQPEIVRPVTPVTQPGATPVEEPAAPLPQKSSAADPAKIEACKKTTDYRDFADCFSLARNLWKQRGLTAATDLHVILNNIASTPGPFADSARILKAEILVAQKLERQACTVLNEVTDRDRAAKAQAQLTLSCS